MSSTDPTCTYVNVRTRHESYCCCCRTCIIPHTAVCVRSHEMSSKFKINKINDGEPLVEESSNLNLRSSVPRSRLFVTLTHTEYTKMQLTLVSESEQARKGVLAKRGTPPLPLARMYVHTSFHHHRAAVVLSSWLLTMMAFFIVNVTCSRERHRSSAAAMWVAKCLATTENMEWCRL